MVPYPFEYLDLGLYSVLALSEQGFSVDTGRRIFYRPLTHLSIQSMTASSFPQYQGILTAPARRPKAVPKAVSTGERL